MPFLSITVRLACFCSLLFLFSCDPAKKINKDYLYFQYDRDLATTSPLKELTIKPNDVLFIQVYSKTTNHEQEAIYNITGNTYLVGVDGNIEFPVLGEVTASGLTKLQLQDVLKAKLSKDVKDPGVLVRFQQFTITVLGDVASPGTKPFTTDKVTILDAISASGDLLPTGVREDVIVSREERDGKRRWYEIDLRSAALFHSPAYQLQQGDIVYVNANRTKLKALKEKGKDPLQVAQVVFSFIGIATSLFLLFRR